MNDKLRGLVAFDRQELEDIAMRMFDQLLNNWHNSNSHLEVNEYMGITQAEYFKFVEGDCSKYT